MNLDRFSFARGFTAAAEIFDRYFPGASLHLLRPFLLVGDAPGCTQTDLARIADVPLATINRHVLALGDTPYRRADTGEVMDGLGLVTLRDDPLDRRRRPLFLTAKGKRLYAEIMSVVGKDE